MIQPAFSLPHLPALLAHQAGELGDAPHARFLDETGAAREVGFREMHDQALRLAAGLVGRGVRPGDRVMLMLATGLPMAASLHACHMVGALPVPLYPPFQLKGVGAYMSRLGAIASQVEAALLVAEPGLHPVVRAGLGGLCPPLVTAEALEAAPVPIAHRPSPDDPALIQFSSGSTGPQKGVVLTHRQLLANCRACAERLALRPGMSGVSWLPLYHDLGLIGGLLIPLLVGFTATLFSPKVFLLDPASWLRAIADARAEITMAPNFAYSLAARRIDPAELEGCDLSCLRIALNGAEPIDPETVRAFNARFGPLGWRPGAIIGVYGLAEVALGVSVPAPESGLVTDPIDPERLRTEGVAAPSTPGAPVRELVSAGEPLAGFEVAILDSEGRQLADRREGQIAVSGPSVMTGYWNNPEGTARAVVDGWLLTGDLGYMADGRLYVTGRLKDLIIRGGRNYHPQELEAAAETVEGVRRGATVAFGLPDPASGTERVVVAFETRAKEPQAVARAVAAAVLAATGLRPDETLPLPPGTTPKTTSGKRQRQEARARYQAGTLGQAESALGALKAVAGNHLAGWRREPV